MSVSAFVSLTFNSFMTVSKENMEFLRIYVFFVYVRFRSDDVCIFWHTLVSASFPHIVLVMEGNSALFVALGKIPTFDTVCWIIQ